MAFIYRKELFNGGTLNDMLKFPVVSAATVAIGDLVALDGTTGRVQRVANDANMAGQMVITAAIAGLTTTAAMVNTAVFGLVEQIETSSGFVTSAAGDAGGTVVATVTPISRGSFLESTFAGTPTLGLACAIVGAATQTFTTTIAATAMPFGRVVEVVVPGASGRAVVMVL